MKIRFTDFWDNFSVHENLFTDYISTLVSELEISSNRHSQVDIEFFSVFPTPLEKAIRKYPLSREIFNKYNTKKSRIQVWFTGENIEPPLSRNLDLYLSFTQDSKANSVYFPLWKFDLDWFGTGRKNPRLNEAVSVQSLCLSRSTHPSKGKRACAFINNMTPQRKRMITDLNRVIPVDVFGASTGNPVASKIEASRDYLFTLCPENSLHRGYTTEKIVEAYASNTIPIYVGMLPRDHKFNLESFFYSESFDFSDDFLKTFSRFTMKEFDTMYEKPLFVEPPSLSELDTLGNLIKATFQ